MSPTLNPEELEHLAQRRAKRKMSWYIHALAFVLVNFGLALLSAPVGPHFAVVSSFIWGLALLVHGAAVFIVPPGSKFQEDLVQQERERLQRL